MNVREKRKPAILMVGPDRGAHGGISSVIDSYFANGIEEKCEVKFISSYKDGTKLFKLLLAVQAYFKFVRIIKHFEIVHVHMASDASFTRKSFFIRKAKAAGKKVVLHIHSGDLNEFYEKRLTDKGRERYKYVLEQADIVIALSPQWKDYLANVVHIRNKIEVLENFVKVDKMEKFNSGSRRVLFLGNMEERKRPDTLIRAAAEIVKVCPDATFYFAGDGDLESFQRLAKDCGVADSCFFLGWQNHAAVEKLFSECSIISLPSSNEGMPMCLLEGLAHGLAVVTTPVGGIPQIVVDQENGFFHEVGDYKTLSNIIIRLFKDKRLLAMIQKHGYLTAKERYSFESGISNLVRIYKSLFKANSKRYEK